MVMKRDKIEVLTSGANWEREKCATKELAKILFTNICYYDCIYCENRRSNTEIPRFSFTPQKLASFFLRLYHRGLAKGLFLSSALGGDRLKTMEKMLITVELLRFKHKFKGYIHLKILPRVTYSYIEQAIALADRVSINLECPSKETLCKIAPDKDWEKDLLAPLNNLSKLARGSGVSLTTQFVVGLGGENDRELLNVSEKLYKQYGLARAYFSPFSPPLGKLWKEFKPASSLRTNRLYQADYLIRHYGFKSKDLVYYEDNLPVKLDPKLAWALNNPQLFPLEINSASFLQLKTIPGIGIKSALIIIQERTRRKITSLDYLKKMGVNTTKASPFILLNGRSPLKSRQLTLWQSV